MWVLFHHMIIFFDLNSIFPSLYRPLYAFARIGYLGVDIFFVISGFLITGLLIDDFESNIRIKRFYLRRFFKIIPHYMLAISAGMIIQYFLPPYQFKFLFPGFNSDGVSINFVATYFSHAQDAKAFPYFVFLQNYFKHMPILAHTWSLAIEEHFYLFYPLVLQCICFMNKNVKARVKYLTITIICLMIAANIYRWYCYENMQWGRFQQTFYRIDALMLGCLIKIKEPYFQELANRLKHKWSLILSVVSCSVMLWYIFNGYNQRMWYNYTMIYLASGGLIIAGFHNESILGRILSFKFLIWIGRQSYGIYLWHYILVIPLIRVFLNPRSLTGVVLYLSISIGVGAFFTLTYERFFLNIRDKIFLKGTQTSDKIKR